jgi:SAM-dependent methyltransferase
MLFWPEVSRRRRQPEIMDEPGLDARRHLQALRGLERINGWSGSARILWPPIAALARDYRVQPLRILDIATGAGDVPIRLWHKARHAGLSLDLAACDGSPQALDYARQRAVEKKATVRFFEWHASESSLPGDYDVVMSSLFLHHLDQELAVRLLRRMALAARRLVLINDLVRGLAGYVLAYVGTRLLSASDVVHTDGPRSVEAAFTIEEVQSLAEWAELKGATVAKRWPCRYLLAWRRSSV